MSSPAYIAAIDQGTTSSRCLIFDHGRRIVSQAQKEHRQYYPKPGWVEHDATEIWQNVQTIVCDALEQAGLSPHDLAAVGITNQRETTLLWDRKTGEPVHHAVVWQDTRTDALAKQLDAELAKELGKDQWRLRTGLPAAAYFSGPKLRWLLDNVEGLRQQADQGELLFGTIDSWLIWNLTGGPEAGQHLTDVTNASRTMLMSLSSLDWDPEILAHLKINEKLLPRIVPSSQDYGRCTGVLQGVPLAGVLGDQQAALFGHGGLGKGQIKSTYGTGAFLLLNTGNEPVFSDRGLLTTVAYQRENQPATYALEGSVAVAGSLVQWLRDQMGVIEHASDIEALARTVNDNGGCYFVPAFAGLFAPHWRSDARGVIAGLTSYITKAHLARAVLEAAAFQTREVIDAMAADTGMTLESLKVDGGMTANTLFMQLLADALNVPVQRPAMTEMTCLGAALAAGLAVGFWSDVESFTDNDTPPEVWQPAIEPARRADEYRHWQKAVQRTLGWVDE